MLRKRNPTSFRARRLRSTAQSKATARRRLRSLIQARLARVPFSSKYHQHSLPSVASARSRTLTERAERGTAAGVSARRQRSAGACGWPARRHPASQLFNSDLREWRRTRSHDDRRCDAGRTRAGGVLRVDDVRGWYGAIHRGIGVGDVQRDSESGDEYGGVLVRRDRRVLSSAVRMATNFPRWRRVIFIHNVIEATSPQSVSRLPPWGSLLRKELSLGRYPGS
jgi:hypothetical protein